MIVAPIMLQLGKAENVPVEESWKPKSDGSAITKIKVKNAVSASKGLF